MSELDPGVLERYADHLERKAGAVVARWTVVVSLLAAALGAVMLTPWASWPVPHREAYVLVLLGAIAGALLGRSLGVSRAAVLRLQAQLARHQLHFERFFFGAARGGPARPEPPTASAPAPVATAPAASPVAAGGPPVSAVAPLPAPDAS